MLRNCLPGTNTTALQETFKNIFIQRIFMTAIYTVTFVMSAVLICKWTLSHYDDDDDDDE